MAAPQTTLRCLQAHAGWRLFAALAIGAGGGAAMWAATNSDNLRWSRCRPRTDGPSMQAAADGATRVATFGLNLIGQLGHGHDRAIAAAQIVAELDDKRIAGVSLGSSASAALSIDGALYTWGSGAYGQLGHGDESSLNLPRLNEELAGRRIVDVAVGGFHMLALDADGRVFTWGRGTVTGQPAADNLRVPTALPLELPAVAIAAGRLHSAAVTSDGSVWTWGNNYEGALGHPDRLTRALPRRMPLPAPPAPPAGGAVATAAAPARAVDVSCGRDFTVVLLEDGSVLSCGADDYGQLGQGRGHGERYVRSARRVVGGLRDVAQISAGDFHCCALTRSGGVFTWGIGRDGQLGHGEKSDQAIPKPVEQLDRVAIKQVCCGGGHTGAVSASGELYLWGRGRDGQLGREGHLESIAAYRTTPRLVEPPNGSITLQASLGADHSALLLARRA